MFFKYSTVFHKVCTHFLYFSIEPFKKYNNLCQIHNLFTPLRSKTSNIVQGFKPLHYLVKTCCWYNLYLYMGTLKLYYIYNLVYDIKIVEGQTNLVCIFFLFTVINMYRNDYLKYSLHDSDISDKN